MIQPTPIQSRDSAETAPLDRFHPLEEQDQRIVDRILAASALSDQDLVDAARLIMRYRGFSGASGIHQGLQLL